MITFLFWNLRGYHESTWDSRKENLTGHIQQIVQKENVDILLFAESGLAPDELTSKLNHKSKSTYRFPESSSKRIQLFTRLPKSAVRDQFNDSSDGRLTVRRVVTPAQTEILLAAVHFQSQLAWSVDEQALQATVLREDLVTVENVVGHQRTVLLGDLNMNPFDPGVVGATTLNAVMERDLARAEERTVAGKPYRFFYNPMWSFFGDRTEGPSGTYFYNSSSPINYYWNMFDQVLLRPTLMDRLVDVRILDHDGQNALVTERGRPWTATISDHLPLLVRLDV